MENKSLLIKLQSKYVFDIIESYIKDDCFICKLFINSKYFQKKLNIKLLYLEKFLTKRINFNDFLYQKPFTLDELNYLQKELNKTIKEYNLNESDIQEVIINYYKKYPIKEFNFEETDTLIEFQSPFFDKLSKLENFTKIFVLFIYLERIRKFKLEDECIKKIEELYKSNINISSINLKYIEKIDDLDYFEKFKINLNLIKRFSVQIHNKDLNCF